MKKTYIIPTLDVVEIKYSYQLLAGSEIPQSLSEETPGEWGAREDDFDFDDFE